MKFLSICLFGFLLFSVKAEAACQEDINVDDFYDVVIGNVQCGDVFEPEFQSENPYGADLNTLSLFCPVENDGGALGLVHIRRDNRPVFFTGKFMIRIDRGELYNGNVDMDDLQNKLVISNLGTNSDNTKFQIGIDLNVLLPQLIEGNDLLISARSNFGEVIAKIPLRGFTQSFRKVCPRLYKKLR